MFSHIVPATYLKSWKVPNSKNSIYIFKKNKITNMGIKRNISNLTRTSFGKINFYYLNIEACNLSIYDQLFIPIISYLENDYYISYKNKPIVSSNPGLFRIVYLNKNYDLKIIRKQDNIEVRVENIKSIINSLWNDSQKKFIEDFFHNNIENDWNYFLKKIKNITASFVMSKSTKKYIMLFITLQIFKSGLQIDNYLSSLIPSFVPNNYQKNNIQNNILIDTIYEFILDFNQNKNNSYNIIYNAFLNLIDSNWIFNFIINKQGSFLTSDTPVFIDYYNTQESIIFPLMPNVCLVLTNSIKDFIKVKESSEYETKIINSLIIKNAKECIAYYDYIIGNNIYINSFLYS